jgi:hydrogenase expression/formation protein HypC
MCLAVPGRILEVGGDDPLARSGKVDFAGVKREVNLSLVPEARVGDFVLVHVGVAIETIDEQEAARLLDYLRQMGDLAEIEESGP